MNTQNLNQKKHWAVKLPSIGREGHLSGVSLSVSDSVIAKDKSLEKIHSHELMSHGLMFKLLSF